MLQFPGSTFGGAASTSASKPIVIDDEVIVVKEEPKETASWTPKGKGRTKGQEDEDVMILKVSLMIVGT